MENKYSYNNVDLKWIKKIFLNFGIDFNNKDIFNFGKNKIDISLFQPLYEYYNFCIKNKDLNPKRYTISEWIWFLFILQTFPDILKNHNIDLYTDSFNEYLKLPNLTGNSEKDYEIMNHVINNFFIKKDGKIRNNILRFYVRFENLYHK